LVQSQPCPPSVPAQAGFTDRRFGAVAQLVRAPPCHGGGRGFEPLLRRHPSTNEQTKNPYSVRVFRFGALVVVSSRGPSRPKKMWTPKNLSRPPSSFKQIARIAISGLCPTAAGALPASDLERVRASMRANQLTRLTCDPLSLSLTCPILVSPIPAQIGRVFGRHHRRCADPRSTELESSRASR
jgi:hypothetical protein